MHGTGSRHRILKYLGVCYASQSLHAVAARLSRRRRQRHVTIVPPIGLRSHLAATIAEELAATAS